MATDFDFTSEAAAKAMVDGLTEAVRSALRKRILDRIEPDIQAAVDAALESFKATIGASKDPLHMQTVIKVLIERKDKGG